MPDTVPGDSTTTVTLTPGTPVSGTIDVDGDRDWYAITLVAGQTYQFTIDETSGAGLQDSYLRLRDSAGIQVAENDDGGQSTSSQLTFTATTSGTYYVDVGSYADSGTGGFNVLVVNAAASGADTVSATTGTSGTVAVGGTVNGTIDSVGDQDWYAVTLTAGQAYIFRTVSTGGAGDVDTYLALRNASGTAVAENDDGGGGTYSLYRYTPTTTGTFYVAVSAFANSSTGAFRVSVEQAPPLTAYSYDQIADQLLYNYWGGPDSWRKFEGGPGGTITVNITAISAAAQTLAREALGMWSDVTGITFSEVSTGGQMLFTDTDTGASTSSSRAGNTITSATVNVSTDWLTSNGTGLNSYSFQTFIHEIGHALGLGHGGNYNSSADYATDALYLNDSWATTVMSYFSQTENTWLRDQGFTRQYVLSPMNGDIVALQKLYGVATTTRIGDTVYGFGNTSGRAIYDAAQFTNVTYTVVDHGGIDTLNYSGFTAAQRIDLNQDAFSNIGGRVGNVVVARGTVIENAVGGSGNDTLIGNSANNRLEGGLGNDTLIGGGGADVFDGGAGRDTVTFIGASAGLAIDTNNASGGSGEAAGDTYIGIESVVGTNLNDQISGTFFADEFWGANGNDFLRGWAGTDSLYGGDGLDNLEGGFGADYLDGGTGFDIVSYGNASAGVRASLANTAVNTGDAAGDTYVSIEGLSGSFLGDDLIGDGGNNQLWGAQGNDVLWGQVGNDELYGNDGDDWLVGGIGADKIDGGIGVDTVRYSYAATGLRADLQDFWGNTGDAAGDLYFGVENIVGSDYNDFLLGDAGNNEVWGDYGNDHIWGRGGNDVLAGGNGVDVFHFTSGWGSDRILDFGVGGAEKLSFDGIAGLTQFSQLTVTSGAGGVTVSFGGNSVLLQGVASITAADVVFG